MHNDCPGGGGFLLPSSRVPGRGMVLDKIDTCIIF